MKFGIIGAGMIGHFHAKAITAMTGGTLHSVFDLRQEAADKLAHEYGARAFSDIAEFLAEPELEIVTVGTPSGAHLDPTLAALKAGKHAIVEKPLEITIPRIDELMSAAEENSKTLAAVLNRRFHPGMDAFKKAADEG
ncbi:Gfo/Idh/MocA family oxidoreductase, partial [Akkermansiaceae bacterium]|nr:Gfo/Idh/MocA family oxidoreductase [Akkermansiaceae bacterium]